MKSVSEEVRVGVVRSVADEVMAQYDMGIWFKLVDQVWVPVSDRAWPIVEFIMEELNEGTIK